MTFFNIFTSKSIIDNSCNQGTIPNVGFGTDGQQYEVDQGEIVVCSVFTGITLPVSSLQHPEVVVWHVGIKGMSRNDLHICLTALESGRQAHLVLQPDLNAASQQAIQMSNIKM